MSSYIRHVAPKEYLDKLIPSYCKSSFGRRPNLLLNISCFTAPGCKRIIVDPKYLKSLHRPNVSLNWDGIEGIVEEGVKLKTGEVVPLDIIIFGTGYSLVRFHASFLLRFRMPNQRRIVGIQGVGGQGEQWQDDEGVFR